MLRNFKTSVNLSLVRALHVCGDHTAWLADIGIPSPLLTLIQYSHLAQKHLRLTKKTKNPSYFYKSRFIYIFFLFDFCLILLNNGFFIFVTGKCFWARWVYCIKVRGGGG